MTDKIANCTKPHTIAEQLILSDAIGMAETMFGKSYAEKFKTFPLIKWYSIPKNQRYTCGYSNPIWDWISFAIHLDEATESSFAIKFCEHKEQLLSYYSELKIMLFLTLT